MKSKITFAMLSIFILFIIQCNNTSGEEETITEQETLPSIGNEEVQMLSECVWLDQDCPYYQDLLNYGDNAIEALIEGIKSQNTKIHRGSISLLHKINTEKSIQALIDNLIRENIIDSDVLSTLLLEANPQAIPAYKRILELDTFYQTEAIYGLAAIGNEEVVQYFKELFTPENEVRLYSLKKDVLRAFSLIGTADCRDFLKSYSEALDDEHRAEIEIAQKGYTALSPEYLDDSLTIAFNNRDVNTIKIIATLDNLDRVKLVFYSNYSDCTTYPYNLEDFWFEVIIPYKSEDFIPVQQGLVPRVGSMGKHYWGDRSYYTITNGLYHCQLSDVDLQNDRITGKIYLDNEEYEGIHLLIYGSFEADICPELREKIEQAQSPQNATTEDPASH